MVRHAGFPNIPIVYGTEPLILERIRGKNIYEYNSLSSIEKQRILRSVVSCLKSLHALAAAPVDPESIYDAYIGKTYARLEKVRDLVPFANDPVVTVNGRACRNVFFHRREIEEKLRQYRAAPFCLIHGDCTFSNIMLREDLSPVLIDPRGYFGHTELYGDPDYDWAKLYYSIRGDYDQFNRKRFSLKIDASSVELRIESSGWRDMESAFAALLGDDVDMEKIRLLHALIWLSLTTYAWENYDSICGAFYNGLFYLEEVL